MGKMNTVAIIGGGVAGLSAGGLLSRMGLRVKLFEANGKLGGSCANTDIGGYTFHDGALYLSFTGVLERVFEKLDLNRSSLLPLRKITASQTMKLVDGTIVTFANGLDVTINSGKDGTQNIQLQREIDIMLKKWEPVYRLFADDIFLHPFSLPRLIRKGWQHLPKLRGTVASEISHLFSDEAVRAAMAGELLYAGVPPQKAPVQSILGLVALLTDGFYLPEGGMGKIPQALSLSLINNGAEIFLNSKIKQIITKNGRIQGLDVEGQGFVEVDAVISTVSGMLTFGMLLDPRIVPHAMKKKVQTVPLSHKALVVQLGLSNRINVSSHANSILPMMDDLYKVFLPDEDDLNWLIYNVPTVTIPELAPLGGSIVELFPAIRQDTPADEWDEQKKEKIATLAVRALSRQHPIEIAVKRVLSPKEFQDDMHLYQGAIYGLSPNADLSAQFAHKSLIRRLYQAGQTTYPGFGVSSAAMSGILAAESLMKKEEV